MGLTRLRYLPRNQDLEVRFISMGGVSSNPPYKSKVRISRNADYSFNILIKLPQGGELKLEVSDACADNIEIDLWN